MLGCKPAETPIELNLKFEKVSGDTLVEKGRYQRLAGKLIYLSHIKPDIAFPSSVVSQHMHNPQEKHLEAVNRILRYLKRTPGKGLFFIKTNERKVEAFTDADWACSVNDRRSTSGYCTFVWGNLVTWRRNKMWWRDVVLRLSSVQWHMVFVS